MKQHQVSVSSQQDNKGLETDLSRFKAQLGSREVLAESVPCDGGSRLIDPRTLEVNQEALRDRVRLAFGRALSCL